MKRGTAFVKIHPFLTICIVLLAMGATFTIAQISGETAPAPPHWFPEGALVYAETEDLERLFKWWRDSKIKADWQDSANYEQFQNSRLYLKLKDRMAKWGAGGNFAFNLENSIQAAGDLSGIALYDIGELKAIAATRLPWEEAKATELWLTKARFQEKSISNHKYYVEPREGALSFAYVEPYLIASTEEALLIRALENLKQPVRTLAQSAKWNLLQQNQERDVSIFLDQEALQKNRYFQKYWIHRNVKDFAGILAIRINLIIKNDAIEENRYFAPSGTTGSVAAEISPPFVEHFQQFRHETLFIDAPVDSETAAQQILHLVNRLPAKDQRASYPPAFSGAAERATQAETKNILLEKIDEPLLQVKSEQMLSASQQQELSRILKSADPDTQIRLSYPLWDNQALFVRFPQTLVLRCKNFRALNQQSFLDQLLQHFLILNATADAGARWQTAGDGAFVLQSFRPLHVQFSEPWIVIATEEPDFRAIAGNLPGHFAAPNGSYGYANWKQSRWKYKRLMQRLDHGTYNDDTPLLFSENIASLLATLEPIVASSVTRSEGKEVIRYELE